MRGDEERQEGMVMLASADDRVPPDHPLRAIRKMVDEALREMSPLLTCLYAERGRVSIPPEYLLRAQLLQILYAIPSERKLCEHIEYNFLFRWFVGLPLTEPMWHHSSFTKNRDRLLCSGVAEVFHTQIRPQAEAHRLLSREHFSCDGTLIETAASLKSFRPRDEEGHTDGGDGPTAGGGRNPEVDFHGERRRNDTHCSRTDPDARLARKGAGKGAKLCYAGHVLVENRNGLIVDCALTQATGKAEEEAGLFLLLRERRRQRGRMTVGADRGYDTRGFVRETRTMGVTPPCGREEERRRHRRAHHQLGRLRSEHASAQDSGGVLWLDEDRGESAQAPSPGRPQGPSPLPVLLCGLQPGTHAQAFGGAISHMRKQAKMRSERAENGALGRRLSTDRAWFSSLPPPGPLSEGWFSTAC